MCREMFLLGVCLLASAALGGEVADKARETADDGVRIYKIWPFGEKEAKQRQEETAKLLSLPIQHSAELPDKGALDLALLPAGEYVLGSQEGEAGRNDGEAPVHRVRITKPFYMGRYEVTVGQYRRFAEATGFQPKPGPSGNPQVFVEGKWEQKVDAGWQNPYLKQDDQHPVVCVSWEDTKRFVEWLMSIDTKKPSGWEYRLPTEAEWEYACRAGSEATFSFGKKLSTAQANFNATYPAHAVKQDENRGVTTPVGSFPPNAWGLHDLHGNVHEWCEDKHHKAWYQESPTDDPLCLKKGCPDCGGLLRLTRGGGWRDGVNFCRSGCRGGGSVSNRLNSIGFRIVLSPLGLKSLSSKPVVPAGEKGAAKP